MRAFRDIVVMLVAGFALAWGYAAEGADVTFHGEVEMELLDAGHHASEPAAHLGFDKFVLQPKVEISDTLKLDAQIQFGANDVAYLNEFHSKFNLSDALLLDVGKFERFIKDWHGRKTEEYPLLGTAFYRDDYWQAMIGYNLPNKKEDPKGFFAALSAGNGLEIDDKQVSTDSSYKIIHDDSTKNSGPFEATEVGVNVGVDLRLGMEGRLGLIGFYYADRLSRIPGAGNDDVDELESLLGGYTTTGDEKTRAGGGVKVEPVKGLRIAGMYLVAKDANVDRSAWFAEVSYKFNVESGEQLQAIEPILRYGQLTVDDRVTKDPDVPGTWDRSKLTVGILFHFTDKVTIRTEYYMNGEETGWADVHNDETVIQLEIKF